MHTNENQSKGRNTGPGEQIAVNRTEHCTIQLFENEGGEYYPVTDCQGKVTLIRGEYHPIGNRLQYPKKWGRKVAAKILLEHKIKVQRDTIESAQVELAKLERCLSDVQNWSDTE